jgi:hypothetical protein
MWSRKFPCVSLELSCNMDAHVPLGFSGFEQKFGGTRSSVSLVLSCNVEAHVPLCVSASRLQYGGARSPVCLCL